MSEMNKLMYVFPGQGSQYQGIGYDLCQHFAVARKVFDQASNILGYDLSKIAFHDPEDQINLTRFTQPILLTHQIACLRVFQELSDSPLVPVLTAGHSLGEYTALVVADVLSFEDGLKLVSRRGELMGKYGEGSMLAMPLSREATETLAEHHHCQVATINLPNQTVVGGKDSDIDQLESAFKELYPKKRAVKLNTEGAFHTDLMRTAAMEFNTTLEQTSFYSGNVPVLSNFTAKLHENNAKAMRNSLFEQLTKPVDWLGCLEASISFEIDAIVEFGGGIGREPEPANKRPNLESIIKKNYKAFNYHISYYSAINIESIKESVASLSSN